MNTEVAVPEIGIGIGNVDASSEIPLVLRPSGIQTYLSCPRKYFYGYVENAPRLVSAALAIGTAFHKGAEVFAAGLRARRPLAEVLPAAEATYEETLDLERTLGDADPEDDRFDTALDTGIGLLRVAAEAIPPDWIPAEVEKTIAAEVAPGVVVKGTTDWVLEPGDIVDFKTRARKSDSGSIRRDIQFTAYALLRNAAEEKNTDPRRLQIVEVTKTKVPAVHIHQTVRDERDFTLYRDTVSKVASAIRAGYDVPVPSQWCGSCQFRRNCPATARHI